MKRELKRKPNLFLVGMPKAGTTSLYHYLSEHPEVFMPKIKDHKYFFTNSEKNKKKYYELFQDAKKEKIIGDASVYYILSKEGIKKIKNFNPKAKIIIMLRDPISFIKSRHNKKIANGKKENLRERLEKEVGLSSKQKKEKLKEEGFGSTYLYLLKKCYLNTKEFVNLFGEKKVKIILQEELEKKPKETYRGILGFLEVDDKEFFPNFKKYNQLNRKRIKAIPKIQKAIKRKTPFLWRGIVAVLPIKARGAIAELNRSKFKQKDIDNKPKSIIKKEMKPYVKELEKITGKNLEKEWF